MDAIQMETEYAKRAYQKKRTGVGHCAIVTIDFKNAFNNASWEAIAKEYCFQYPLIIGSFFENLVMTYKTETGLRSTALTVGFLQGSILGPVFWNAMYNEVLTLKLPAGAQIVGFADDIVLKIIGETSRR